MSTIKNEEITETISIEQDNTKETNDDITKAFIKFIKEYRNGNIFKYR